MKGKLFLICALGAALGIALSTMITVGISLCIGDGQYYAVVPALVEDCGGELNAVCLQTLLSMIYGAAWAGASLIWRQEGWSLTRQTVTHLLICSVATFPVAWLCRWMRHDAAGAAVYFGVFFAIYALIWLSQYLNIRHRVRAMNREIDARRPHERT